MKKRGLQIVSLHGGNKDVLEFYLSSANVKTLEVPRRQVGSEEKPLKGAQS